MKEITNARVSKVCTTKDSVIKSTGTKCYTKKMLLLDLDDTILDNTDSDIE